MDLKETEGNSFWATARREGVEEKMRFSDNFAIQGELVGPGIQGNIYKLSQTEFYVYDVYDIKDGEYLKPADRVDLITRLGLKHVPVQWHSFPLAGDVDTLLAQAEGRSWLNKDQEREGIVFKEVNGGMSFKAISNKYLLGEK
jgi:ATP-dependent RNA circularization protein (DNA/RNA ligase family)